MIIAALLIAVLTFSLAASIHEIISQQQELSYTPVQELVLGVTGDFERALNYACSVASQIYNTTRQFDVSASTGAAFMANWAQSVITAYSNTGLDVTVTSQAFNFNWGSESGQATSQCSASFTLDAPSYGFQGYIGQSQKTVSLSIEPLTIDVTNSSRTSLKFNIRESSGGSQDLPIPNLTKQSLFIKASSAPGLPRQSWPNANVVSLAYLGNGEYNVTFTPRININSLGVIVAVITPQEGIMVEAAFEQPLIATTTLQSRETNSPNPTANNGIIQFGDYSYSLPNSVGSSFGTYILRYFPDTDYTFVNWEVTVGNATIDNPSSNPTLVEISGNTTIVAIYRSTINPIVTVGLSSRALDGSSVNLGAIVFNSVPHSLNDSVSGLSLGDYGIEFVPPSGMYFWSWEASGSNILVDSAANPTTLRAVDDGSLVAVYSSTPPSITVSVVLQSREEDGVSVNLGSIQLGSQSYSKLPGSPSVLIGSYLLDYSPVDDYTFVRWEVPSGDIVLGDDSSQVTQANVNGTGTITAVYRSSSVVPTYSVRLDSRALDNSSQHLGNITLGSTRYYTLPAQVQNMQLNSYVLSYSCYNATFIFLQWDSGGSVFPWNSSDSSTQITINGNGTITAVYGPAPFNGGGDALYVDNNNELNTNGQLSDKWLKGGNGAKLSANFSSSNQEIDSYSDPLPTFYVASVIKVITYVELSQGQNAKSVTLTVGFNYNGWSYELGTAVFPVASQTVGIYELNINVFNEGNWTSEYGPGVIPAGSTFFLQVSVFFDRTPYGTMFLRYGKDFPTRIQFL